MLIQPDSNKLGDKRLRSGKEILAQQFEKTDARLEPYRLDDQKHLKDTLARMGQPMLSSELIRRVKLMNPKIFMEPSRSNIHLYGKSDGRVLGFYMMKGNQKVFLGAFDEGWLPEYSFIHTDTADLPIEEKRGWRTVLTRLITQGALTRTQVSRAFQEPSLNARSRRWHKQLKGY